jgi:hypothetical protein
MLIYLDICCFNRPFDSQAQTRSTSSDIGRGMTMKTEAEIRFEGIHALIAALGPVDAERFIAVLRREQFDYTRWRKDQWSDATVASLAKQARALREGTEEAES